MGTVITWHLPFSHLEHFHNMDCMIRDADGIKKIFASGKLFAVLVDHT